jgi:1,2-diacylglycerol 3-beta-glucosyltransferase
VKPALLVVMVLGAALTFFGFALLLPTLADLWSLLAPAARRRHTSHGVQGRESPPRILFLVPAHNESLLIAECVRSLLSQHYPREAFAVIVIADNCADDTAARADAAGALCLVRTNLAAPGKPRAIAWALTQVALDAYDAVAVIDADTVVDPEFAARMADAAPLADKCVQGFNGVANPSDSPITRMATVFADAKCRFAYGIKDRAGLNLPVRLGGCVGTGVLQRYGWDAFSIGEDWELYALLTLRGVRIEGAPEARVYAQEARSLRQGASQRQRWAAGKLTVLARLFGDIVSSRTVSVHQKLDLLSELSAPGPVVHAGIAAAGAMLALGASVPSGRAVTALFAAGVIRHVAFTLAALRIQPDPARAAGAFLFLPLYLLWRLPTEFLALRMLGDKPWVRTERHSSA